jgi:hypothetical protein
MRGYRIGLLVLAASMSTSLAQATLIEGTPTPYISSPANPLPRFGTLIDFDDGVTGDPLAADRYVSEGVTSIVNLLGPSLGFWPTSQSVPNYIGTGEDNDWNADILVEFTDLQAAVGIGIAGPTTLLFELLDASMNPLESYSLSTTPDNTYYYINRLSNDTKFLHVKGDFIAIDDLQFDTQTVRPVPEPGTLALMFAGLGVVRRYRRRS